MKRTLTIRRVPTVVSNYQENGSSDDLNRKIKDCSHNCLGNCCLPDSNLPLYVCTNADYETDEIDIGRSCRGCHETPFLKNLLLGQWEDRLNRGLFRYDVTSCETKVIPGKYGFIAQLNEGRHLKKRPTEFRIDKVLQPFDENKFNFTKVGQEEVLFRFEISKDGISNYFPTFPVDAEKGSPSVIAINVSPIEYGHVLLIPCILDCLPQKIDSDSLFLALHLAKEASDPFFRLGYNSLGAFATINHLHFQAYYLSVPFPIEKAPTCKIMSSKGQYETRVVVSKLLNYPVRCLVFCGGCQMRDLCNAVANSCISLQNQNIAFNLLISDCGERIFLLPQCYAEKQARGEVNEDLAVSQVNPAVWEISGHMVLKRKKDYNEASEEYALRLLAEVSLSEERFQEVVIYACEAANLQPVEECIDFQQESRRNSGGVQVEVSSHHPKDCLVLH